MYMNISEGEELPFRFCMHVTTFVEAVMWQRQYAPVSRVGK
jgi:hypothetical protein